MGIVAFQQGTVAGFGIHAESPWLLGNDQAFSTLILVHGSLASQRAAPVVRTRWAVGTRGMECPREQSGCWLEL